MTLFQRQRGGKVIWIKYVYNCFIWNNILLYLLFQIGTLKIRPDKKAEPQIKKASKIGMIAGGTGVVSVAIASLLLFIAQPSILW